MKRICTAVALATAACWIPAVAQAQSSAPWSGSVTPYLWMPNFSGTFRYDAPSPGSGRPEVESKPHDYLDDLRVALMLAAEVRRDRLSLFSDLIYLDLKAENSAVRSVAFGGTRVPVDGAFNSNTRTSLKGFAWSGLAGYSLESSPQSTMDVFAGLRYFGLKAESGWQLAADVPGPGSQAFERSGSASKREDLWDGVVGLRGRVGFGDGRWAMPYYADVGTGSSRVTWQVAAGVTYAFGWGDLGLFYRQLSYEQTGDKLVSDLDIKGPALSLTVRF